MLIYVASMESLIISARSLSNRYELCQKVGTLSARAMRTPAYSAYCIEINKYKRC